MSDTFIQRVMMALVIASLIVTFGCGKKEDPSSAAQTEQVATQTQPSPQANQDQAEATQPALEVSKEIPRDVAVSVDGVVLKKDELARRIKEKMTLYKDKIPADKKKEVEQGLKKQITEEFVMKTILNNEADAKKIVVSKKEIQSALDQISANIPPGRTLEQLMKENGITREDVALGIRIRKLVEKEAGGKTKPTEKEISKFYTDNKEKFTSPETVHVRHILVTIDAKDDEKTKAEKKAKIDGLRKQVAEGADFAETAKKNSDCPSKENGGDLGDIKRGQTVKPFEDAAFSQDINVIGPVVTTEFGHHVIQVLSRTQAETVNLEEVKDQIGMYLEQQKQAAFFEKISARLRKNAAIIYYDH